jgi:diguanylate cyclase (GGDEF)-like protein
MAEPNSLQSDREKRRDDLQREIEALEGRDYQLWSIAALLLVVLTAGLLALIWPNLIWGLGRLELGGRYLPQLLFGFIALVVLANIYLLDQRRNLRKTRRELFAQMIYIETLEELATVDPLTETLNRRSLDDLLTRETSRADRLGTDVALLMIDVDHLRKINARLGHLVGDQLLKHTAATLRATFRKSDTIIRYGGDEFLVVMPETGQEQAQLAVLRLLERIDDWNKTHPDAGYEVALSCGLAAYRKGMNIHEVLASADRIMYQNKSNAAR